MIEKSSFDSDHNQILTLGILLMILTILLLSYKISSHKSTNIPTVPGGLPFFGQVFTLLKGSPWDTFAKWAVEFHPVFKIHLFGSDMICVADPTVLKIILNTKLSVFKKDLNWTYKPFLSILGNGLVTADGQSHRHQRTLLASHFRSNILELIPDMAFHAYERLTKKIDAVKLTNSIIEMSEEFRHLTLQVIAEAILSLPAEESNETFAHMYLPIVEEGNRRTWSPERAYLPNYSWLVYGPAVARLNDYVTNLIIKRRDLKMIERQDGKFTRKQDVLDIRIDAVADGDWNNEIIKQIRDEVKTFILAGHETSASMLTWALLELVKNPKCLEHVRMEARQVYAGHLSADGRVLQSLPPYESLKDLKYTESCLRESLRRYSVVPSVVRMTSEDIQIDEYFVPKGSTIVVNIQGVHHNPKYWPDPLKYDPSRFMGGQEIESYTFLPFVEGPRVCIGQFLSLLETKVILSSLILRYDFKIENVAEANEKHPFMVPIIPKNGHHMRIL